MKRIYLDYAASTPVDPRVERVMRPYFLEYFGNPGSLHFFGQRAITALDESRESIASSLGVDFREVIFTGSATEANNLALRGAVLQWTSSNKGIQPRVIVSSIEHESVLETARDLEAAGAEVIYIPVDARGIVDINIILESINQRTVLVSIMYANNEVGSVQPIAEIAAAIKNVRQQNKSGYPLLHTDAVQAFQFFDCIPGALGVDMMTISSHKIYGPKGVGLLYVRTSAKPILKPIVTGGGQEFGFRSGTENVALIVGFAKAIEIAIALRKKETKRIATLKTYFWKGIKKIFPNAEMNAGVPAYSLPNILNIYFPGYSAEDLVVKLDLLGIAVSSGSACRSRAMEISYVIQALALGSVEPKGKSSIRFSFGRATTKNDIDRTLKVFKKDIAVVSMKKSRKARD